MSYTSSDMLQAGFKLLLCYVLASFDIRQADGRSHPAGVGWSYDGTLGPNEWARVYPACNGRMQSPINIERNHVLYDYQLSSFDLRQYGVCTNCRMILQNMDGHTAEVSYDTPGNPIVIRGGSLPDEYVLDQFHFHWGKQNSVGSEHLLDNKAAPLEMHIVHHMKKYNQTEAAHNPYGLAVLGFFFEIGYYNPAFEKLLTRFKDILHINNKVQLVPFALADLLPPDSGSSYYRYYGSLTTPPCYETVIWTLFTTKIKISQSQMDTFRTLRTVKYSVGNRMTEVELSNDYRPVQELHERRVTSNDKTLNNDIAKGIIDELRKELNKVQTTCSSSNPSPCLGAASATQKFLCIVWSIFFIFR